MSPEQKRKFNSTFGGIFFAAGVIGWGLTAYFAITPAAPKPAPTYAGTVVNLDSCSRALKMLGYPDVKVDKGDVIAHEPLGDDPKSQLERASIAATMCKLEMKSFCMGEACSEPGLTIVTTKPEGTRTASDSVAQAAPASGASGAHAASTPFGKAAPFPKNSGAKRPAGAQPGSGPQ